MKIRFAFLVCLICSVCYVSFSCGSEESETDPMTLEAPTNVKASLDKETNIVTITWKSVKYAESYAVYRYDFSSDKTVKLVENCPDTYWLDTPSKSGEYNYYVCANGKELVSQASIVSNTICIEDIIYTKNKIEVTVNGVCFNMIKVEGGTFQMGSTSGFNDERPVHQVTLTNDYYIGETEVTQKLWTAVMGSNPSHNTRSNQFPVEKVSWDDCQTFITRLNTLTGRTFRLPTEAEWEFAARGGNASVGYTYSGSNTLDDAVWYRDNSGYQTHEVATKAPNELGIYDMSGNVWEWCQDWYGSYSSYAQTNPTGPTSGSFRVNRGGSCVYDAAFSRVAARNGISASSANNNLGLRLAL